MSNDTQIPMGMLPTHCDRKGKIVNVKLPVDDMKAHLENIEARKRNGAALLGSLGQIEDGQIPDLIVVFRGEAYVLPTVVVDTKQDHAVKRALNTALGEGEGRTFYDVPAPTPRKASEKADNADAGEVAS